MTSRGPTALRGRVDHFGASVTGPAHRALRRPNEDQWLGASGAFGSLVVVSDGVGSKIHARHGARKVCVATLRAVRAWHKGGTRSIDDLIGRIEPLWLEEIAPLQRSDCAATCLLALAHADGMAYVAALGDGMAAVRTRGVVERVEHPRGSGFSNETQVLGGGGVWAKRCFESSKVDMVVLASDGVSDDLRPDRLSDFVAWLKDEFASLQPVTRYRALRRELTEWPTPRHLDDKTIAVLVWPRRAAV
jgi:serine/threonine protein phosphatase PrpC